MNATGITVLESALNNATDDLERAKHTLKKSVGMSEANLKHVRYAIIIYQRMVDDLTEALAEAKGNGHTETKTGTERVS